MGHGIQRFYLGSVARNQPKNSPCFSSSIRPLHLPRRSSWPGNRSTLEFPVLWNESRSVGTLVEHMRDSTVPSGSDFWPAAVMREARPVAYSGPLRPPLGAYQFWECGSGPAAMGSDSPARWGTDPLGKAFAGGKCRHKRLPPWSAADAPVGLPQWTHNVSARARSRPGGPPTVASHTPKSPKLITTPRRSRRFGA